MSAHTVIATIPTFKPAADIFPLIESLTHSCPVLVSDDASPATSDSLLRSIQTLPRVKVLRHQSNTGIGRGLNEGLREARDLGLTWLLTVDQDSILPPRYVSELGSAMQLLASKGLQLGALGAGAICVADAMMRYPGHVVDYGRVKVLITEEVIQSGTIWNVDAMLSLGGFNETFGMDAVDAHACLRLREAGLVVAAVEDLEINHRIGSAQAVSIKGRNPVFLTGHSPERRTSMVRNRLALFPSEFRQSPRHAFRTLRRVLINQVAGLMVETDKLSKARGSLRGLIPSRKR